MMSGTKKFHGKRVHDRDVDSFFGLCLGMLADGDVNESEGLFLLEWLNSRPDVVSGDPLIGDIHWRLRNIFDDGVMDADESLQLLKALTAYTGCPQPDSSFERAACTLPLCDPFPVVNFSERSFCFTGTFSLGDRGKCSDILQRFGGVLSKNVTLKIDYLVVGHNVTLDWKHQSYGNKILKAMKYRDEKGRPIAIISEKHWVDSMRNVLKAVKKYD